MLEAILFEETIMVGEVIAFAIIISIFEFIIIASIPPYTKLRILGSAPKKVAFHVGMLVLNFVVHWGTVIGTMSATLAFITSIVVMWAAAHIFGYVKEDRYYTIGWVKYSKEEIK